MNYILVIEDDTDINNMITVLPVLRVLYPWPAQVLPACLCNLYSLPLQLMPLCPVFVRPSWIPHSRRSWWGS